MTISRWAKAIVYLVFSTMLLAACFFLQNPMHTATGLVAGYFRAVGCLFIFACCSIGTSLYTYRAYTRRHREHLWDNLFLLLIGLAAMAAVIILFLNYGGMGEGVTEDSYTASNACIILLSVLPVPFIVRTLVLAFSCRHNRIAARRTVQFLALVLAVSWVALAASGLYLKTMPFSEPTHTSDAAFL